MKNPIKFVLPVGQIERSEYY